MKVTILHLLMNIDAPMILDHNMTVMEMEMEVTSILSLRPSILLVLLSIAPLLTSCLVTSIICFFFDVFEIPKNELNQILAWTTFLTGRGFTY